MFCAYNNVSELRQLEDRAYRARENISYKIAALISYSKTATKSVRKAGDTIEHILLKPESLRKSIISHPLTFIWMKSVVRALEGYGVAEKELDLSIEEIEYISSRFLLEEEDVHPILKRCIPPTYEFKKEYIRHRNETNDSKSYKCAIETACCRAGTKINGFDHLLKGLVKAIVIVPDAGFRSCSAERYVGVIILGTSDQSLIELEESIVHEYAHQILYQIDFLDGIFIDQDDKEKIVLPWSKTSRNFYGFFHACFVYTILREYYKLSIEQNSYDQEYCQDRLMFIQDGLSKVTPYLANRSHLLNEAGQSLLRKLTSQINNVPMEA